MFGAPREDVDHFLKKSPKKAVRELLQNDHPLPAPPVNNYNDDKYTDAEIAPGADWTVSLKYDGMNNGRRKNSFKSWWFGLMVGQDRSIREKMVLFWHNHFVTETNTVDNALFCYRYNVLLRQHALGNFKTLVRAMTAEPAMLRYLNGYVSTKAHPDENYGRELQELFTVGKGPGSHYTESDVKAAARVLTGYTINYKTFTTSYDPNRHDEGDKQFSAFYDNHIIHGMKGKEAEGEVDQLIDMIFSRDEVSKFFCRKLYRFFVYHTIDEPTEQNVIEPLAKMLRKKDYEVVPVLEALLTSQHFFDAANYGGMIKPPVDFTVGLCREFNVPFPAASEYVDQYGFLEQVRNQAAGLQQNIGDPPNVAGWQAYYQTPEYDKLWISSDTLPKRNQFSDRMVNNGFARNGKKIGIDVVAFAASLPNPEDPDKLIAGSVQALYAVALSPEELQFIKSSILLSGLVGMSSDHYWTNAWVAYQAKPDDKANRNTVTNKLKNLYRHLLDLPEYQLL
ncbi:hypothetical protein GCM10011511_03400 [Puia dinghuensis]|uniref:DUF1800 domain-containing protein n=2 Tax=Puia dinghuensis TaxID=1792502 RepID=A0A8J2U753_9BACT|nr:hypothetical protein GCM10011511_03400 [Puia dinghuensis]